MNLIRRRSLTLAAIACVAAALFSACQSEPLPKPAYFAEASQSTTTVDLRPGASGRTGVAVEGTGRPEGLGRSGRYYYYIRNGTATRLYQRQRFAQGWWIDGKGQVIDSNGNIVLLSNGEMVTFAGEKFPIPPGVTFP